MKTQVVKFLGTLVFAAVALTIGAQPTKLPDGVTRQQIDTHVFSPANIQNVQTDEYRPDLENKPQIFPSFKSVPTLNIGAFGQQFHNSIKDKVTGYAFQLRKNGAPVYTLIWNWAQTPANASQGWTLDTRMHVASVSKLVTAMAMMKLLDSKGISYDAKIINYLPAYWAKGPNISQISFRNLFNHTSGFSTGGSSSDFLFMKNRVQMGVPSVGSYDYENMNFGLCRVLLAIINGNISKNANYGIVNDQIWDVVTINAYKNYVQANVFTPAGVNNVSFEPLLGYKNALAYKFPHLNQGGWDSGNLASVSGGAGWRLSVNEMLKVMDAFRRKNTIVPAAKAQLLLDSAFGIDQIINTPAGKLYNKNGSWGSNGRTEQCVAYFLPEGMELVVFVNSPINTTGDSLRGLVKDVYVANLH